MTNEENNIKEDRINEILDAAQILFFTKGFDNTSISDILKEITIARGTLYYYFKSKEEIMDGIINRQTRFLIDHANTIAEDKSMPVLKRMAMTIAALGMGNHEEELLDHIHQPQNALMHEKINNAILTEVTPILTKIVEEGINEGLFNTPHPHEAMEMIIAYANTVFNHSSPVTSEEELNNKISAFVHNFGLLLGIDSEKVNLLEILGGKGEDQIISRSKNEHNTGTKHK